MWILGDLRLSCGDSTKPEDMAQWMAGEKAMLLTSDAPYFVEEAARSVQTADPFAHATR